MFKKWFKCFENSWVNCLNFSFYLFCKRELDLEIRFSYSPSEGDMFINFKLPFIVGFSFSLDYSTKRLPRGLKWLGKGDYNRVSTGISLSKEYFVLELLNRDHWDGNKSKGIYIIKDWEDILKGVHYKVDREPIYSFIHGSLIAGKIVMFHFSVQKCTIRYRRWFNKTTYSLEISSDHELIFDGKGENSWDQGEDSTGGLRFLSMGTDFKRSPVYSEVIHYFEDSYLDKNLKKYHRVSPIKDNKELDSLFDPDNYDSI